ncbi:MAG: uroporphyrinogen decarboxylase family protein [Capsulimonadaceae bacterium]|nr:uroporphyrinogen decarboxylase family protein [Capsulimonadaceae bacterium]
MLSQRIGEIHGQLAIRSSANICREEYLEYMTFQANDRPLFTEIFGPLLGLKEEWRAQGATEAEIDMSAFRYRRPKTAGIAVNAGLVDALPEAILSEDDDYLVGRDGYGRTVRLSKGAATLPLPENHPIQTMDDWLAFKHRYAYTPERFRAGWEADAREKIASGHTIVLNLAGAFDEPRNLMGEEALCIAYYEDPELVHDMMETLTKLAVNILCDATSHIVVDQVAIHEDMAGKSGPLIGPRQVREFVAPYYRKVRELLDGRGGRLLFQDSDGDITSILDLLVDAGLNVASPCEPVGGMNIVALREKYGKRLAFVGGIDKHCLLHGRDAIDRELNAKIPPLLSSGGCVFALDHRIPNGITMEAYRYYVAKAWELLDGSAS